MPKRHPGSNLLSMKIWRCQMSNKPEKLDEILSEKKLCDWLDLDQLVSPESRSRKLTAWIRGGLRHVEKSERRYFFEQDVIEYLWGQNEGGETE
jgi:hypothetical protein